MKKKYIIIISILLAYVVLMVIIFGTDLFRNKTYIIIGSEEKLKYEKGQYLDIKASEKSLYQGQKFDIYDTKGHVGKYILKYHKNKWHAFSDNYDFVSLESPIFAIKTNKKYSVPDYEIEELNGSDLANLNQMLKEHNIRDYNLSVNQKVTIDLDNDGKKETLFAASNLFEDEDADGYFSLVYYTKNNKKIFLKEKYYDIKDSYKGELYNLTKLIDIKNNGKVEIIITKRCFSMVCDDCSEIYTLKWGKYKNIRTCE